MEHRYVDNVEAEFDDIPHKLGEERYLGAWNGLIPWPRYTSALENAAGVGEHFQGVQRVGDQLVLSGGRKRGGQESQLIVLRMRSGGASRAWSRPRYPHSYKRPGLEDQARWVVKINETLWHAGGIQALGDVIGVPVYGEVNRSEIRFFRIGTAWSKPREIEDMCLERSKRQAKAIGMTYHPRHERSLLAVWDDEKLDFHWSKEKNLRAGFEPEFSTRKHYDLGHGFRPGGLLPGTYQSINLVTDVDGTVYLIGTRNESKASPTVTAPNWMDLYRLSWAEPPEDTAARGGPATPPTDPPRVDFLRGREIKCKNQQCNFGAAAGIYVDDEKHMFLYAAAHWLHDGNKRFNFNEYSPE